MNRLLPKWVSPVAVVATQVSFMATVGLAEGPLPQTGLPRAETALEAKAESTDRGQRPAAITRWQSLLTPADLAARLDDPHLLIIDARSPDDYAKGHLPGAINLPGIDWRTPEVKPGQGPSQYLFRDPANPDRIDLARYEALLSTAGVRNDHRVVVYGNHAGKTDGSVPAMILRLLGHRDVAFLDGIGVEQWTASGYALSTQPRTLAPSTYSAVDTGAVWSLAQVLERLDDPSVVFHDTRSAAEFSGKNPRDNARGGHIPGAALLNYEDLLDPNTRTALPPQAVARKLAARGITPDKTVVLYCQTATRVSLPYLLLGDLGYHNIAVYDASWFEYGNRDDTPVATGQ